MNAIDKMLIEHECAKLSDLYCHYLDHRDPEGFADLFADDGLYKPAIQPVAIAGRDNILAWFHTYPADRTVRHLATNKMVTVVDSTYATGRSYAVTFREPNPETGVISDKSTPRAVVEYFDTYCKTYAGWKFATRFYNIDFLDGSEPNRPPRTTSIK